MTEPSRLLTWARVLRLSLFPSAMADPIVGVFLGLSALAESAPTGTESAVHLGPTVALSAAASLCVYHGAMALNDWADRKVDAERGRARPLVLGLLLPGAVLLMAMVLLLLGPALAHFGGLGSHAVLAIGVAALVAVIYDLAGRGPLLGPALLGLARGSNLIFGALASGWALGGNFAPAACALLYGLFVFGIGRLGRMEDGEDAAPLGRRPSRLLVALGLWLSLAPLFVAAALYTPAAEPVEWYLAFGGVPFGLYLLGTRSWLLWSRAKATDWTPAKVEAVMGPVLSSLVPFTVGTLLLAAPGPDAWVGALVVLLAARLGRRLMRFIPPS